MNNPQNFPYHAPSVQSSQQASEPSIPQLVGQVYEAAPVAERTRLIAHLIKPLGVLSLIAVANGIFAKARFRSTWPDMQLRLEDIGNVSVSDVIALVDRVQQVSVEAVDGLAQLVAGSTVLAGSAAAMLVTVLVQRSRTRRAEDSAQSI